MNQLRIVVKEQEVEDVSYEFGNNIPTYITNNLLSELNHFKSMAPEQIIFLAIMRLFEERANRNIDYLQVFEVIENNKHLTFWAISNLPTNEKATKESNVTFCYLMIIKRENNMFKISKICPMCEKHFIKSF